MRDKCIISFANSRGNYLDGIARLGNSLKGKFDGDFIGFIGEQSLQCPLHEDDPYSFKIYAIQKARDAGYTKIVWLDASVYAVRDIQPVFEDLEKSGYIMQEAGHYIGTWANDFTLNYFGLTRDDAMQMLCYGNAGFLGLNFDFPIAQQFFSEWTESLVAGCFKGSWTNDNNSESMDARVKGHRHDLTCGSIIATRLGMKYKSGNEWLEYASPDTPKKNDTIIFRASGL